MGSRPVVPVPTIGEEAVMVEGKGKQKKENGVAQWKNRRALGDIGNLVPAQPRAEGKHPQQISRPITRSFCAQLLANAQAEAAAENKKLACINLKGDKKAVGLEKRVPKREVKEKKSSKPVEVIDSLDTAQVIKVKEEEKAVLEVKVKKEGKAVQEVKVKQEEKTFKVNKENAAQQAKVKKEVEEKAVEIKEAADKTARQKVPTLTSVLTARSKAASGLSRKPEDVEDIDAADAGDELAVLEYVDDLYLFYKETENECHPIDYMLSQPEINEKMRAILVDWLICVHHKFELTPETLYLTINIIDRFLSAEAVPKRELQLLGMGAMLIASKYEEIWAPQVSDFVCIADRAYTDTQVLVMEKTILGKLEWTLTMPTHYVFLARFVKASLGDEKLKNMAYFMAELGLMNYSVIIRSSPSMVAASAIYAARCAFKVVPFWNRTLEFHTGCSESQVMDCAKTLASLHMKVKDNKLQGAFKKYSKSEMGAVALILPGQGLIEGGCGSSTSA